MGVRRPRHDPLFIGNDPLSKPQPPGIWIPERALSMGEGLPEDPRENRSEILGYRATGDLQQWAKVGHRTVATGPVASGLLLSSEH